MVRSQSRRAVALAACVRVVGLFATLVVLEALAACGPPTIDVGAPFTVVATEPSHGATGVAVDVLPTVTFNRAVIEATAANGIQLKIGDTAVERDVTPKEGGKVIELIPRLALPKDKDVTIEIASTLETTDGVQLETKVDATFHTAK